MPACKTPSSGRAMSTSGSTGSSTSGSKAASARLGYTPGASIFTKRRPAAEGRGRQPGWMRARDPARERPPFLGCTPDAINLILGYMLAKNDALSVMKLSMVNREFRQHIQHDWAIWLGLYRRWTRTYFRYSTMMTLPNFRRRVQPAWCVLPCLDHVPATSRPRARGRLQLERFLVQPAWCASPALPATSRPGQTPHAPVRTRQAAA